MKKTLLTAIVIFINVSMALAGGYVTNTNQTVHYLRNPSRYATLDIDAIYFNPAGTVKLGEGLHFTVNNQSAFQTRKITTTFAPFKGFGGSQTKEFDGEASALVIPSLLGSYNFGKWAISGGFAVAGGGGTLTFDRGLPSFESQMATIGALAQTRYSLDSRLEGSSITYGVQLGGSYAINDMLSVYGGARLNIVSNGYTGHLNVKFETGGNMVPGEAFFNGAAAQAEAEAAATIAAGGDPTEFLTKAATSAYLATQVADKVIDVKQSGMGITPIIGLNFNFDKLNVGLKYEFNTSIEIENETEAGKDAGQDAFKNGVKTPNDMPAILAAGVSYQLLPQLSVSGSYNYFFDKGSKMANDKQDKLDGGTSEYAAGIEYQINKMFLVSGGASITRFGITDEYITDLSFSLNSYSIGFGGAVNVTENIRVNLAYLWSVYSDYTRELTSYGTLAGNPMPAGKDVFSRTNKVFGIGVDISF